MHISDTAPTWLFGVVCIGLGAFLGAYLKRKGENLATHEDLDKLVRQMEATTQATKAIEARIDERLWNKQRRWEITRDVLFESCRAMAEFDTALWRLHTVFTFEPKEGDVQFSKLQMATHESDASRALNEASNSFKRAHLLASIVAGNEVQRALTNMNTILLKLSSDVVNGRHTTFKTLAPLIKGAEKVVIEAIRKELGIGESVPTSQTTGSSATDSHSS
jgi:hypothetical protein